VFRARSNRGACVRSSRRLLTPHRTGPPAAAGEFEIVGRQSSGVAHATPQPGAFAKVRRARRSLMPGETDGREARRAGPGRLGGAGAAVLWGLRARRYMREVVYRQVVAA